MALLLRDDDEGEEATQRRTRRHLQLVFTRKMQERQLFMEELKAVRKKRTMQIYKSIIESIGPKWYFALSLTQRNCLDNLKSAMYQDLLEGRPKRTMKTLKILGINPCPRKVDLYGCMHHGRDDPKKMLAALYLVIFGHYFNEKRASYSLNAQLILSAIFYLGSDEIIQLLRERFKPVPVKEPPKPKPKLKMKVEKSPYLQRTVAAIYEPPKPKRFQVPPLPPVDALNDQPYEEPPKYKPPPPPPPPPLPPKKRLSLTYCERMAGIIKFNQPSKAAKDSGNTKFANKKGGFKKLKTAKFSVSEIEKKTYGIGITNTNEPRKVKKPKIPKTTIDSARYSILGVFTINSRSYYVLGGIIFTSTGCEVIHGGHCQVNGEYIMHNLGYRAFPGEFQSDECDCLTKWNDPVFEYLKNTKCYCNHHYDYRNEGTFPLDELPFFTKPTPFTSFSVDYGRIFELHPNVLHVEKEVNKIWETEPILVKDPTMLMKKEKEKEKKKKKLLRSSNSCLGDNPNPEDYLKCAVGMMMQVNLAAQLPDVHLVPELKEWMRRRLFGPYTRHQKAKLLDQSFSFWSVLKSMDSQARWHLHPPQEKSFMGSSSWIHTSALRRKFAQFMKKYKRAMFQNVAFANNLLWASMCQAQFPSKRFMQIYFDYVVWRYEELYMMNAYSPREAHDRQLIFSKNHRQCPAKGMEKSISGEPREFGIK